MRRETYYNGVEKMKEQTDFENLKEMKEEQDQKTRKVEEEKIPIFLHSKKAEMIGRKLEIVDMGDAFLVPGANNEPNMVKSVMVRDLETRETFSFLISKGSALDRRYLVGIKGVTIGFETTLNGFSMHVWVKWE